MGINVTVTILGIKGNQIGIGIDVPHDITVNREGSVPTYSEIKGRIKRAKHRGAP